ncbi:Pre-mRNA splicing factor PRP21 like protein-domain-containing protein [Dunaliella salina]|uniref:Pre-mRNA splicing factor PRP21 like protein-domain-containing protein n=1 Tax=Dunaliella salina TaxID=3046 RepID=A0ABQ7H853_DUNSA|nr:Pre-mRNA splicing factor PRP21 like protein-domain-containing protein [Dunaliella salina]|eukprot:KAF5843032.1 Pre-mRNA splicing factor PRP21 like protein-domain-containing protein [Dunaliella salina]
MANEQVSANGPANGPANQAIVVSDKAQQPNGEAGSQIVVSSEVRTAGFNLEEVKKLATQTKAIGVILPPPDIRAIVDKTAQFVAKHVPGAVPFQCDVNDERGMGSAVRIKNFSETKDGQAPKDQGPQATQQAAEKITSQLPQPVPHALAKLEKPDDEMYTVGWGLCAAFSMFQITLQAPQPVPHALAKLEKPDDEMYTVHVPEGLSVLELDTIKLAAQFVARNGKSFLTGLSSREHTSPAFAFLRPTHSLFGFFTGLCDAYSRCLMPPKGTKDKLAVDSKDAKTSLLARATKRLEWERVREKEVKDAEIEAEKERAAYQSIDWHDFVVVEMIEFYDDEDEELPPPLTLKDVITMNKARAYADEEEKAASEVQAEAKEKVQPMNEEERNLVAQAAAVTLGGPQQQPPPQPPQQPPPQQAPAPAAPAPAPAPAPGITSAPETAEEPAPAPPQPAAPAEDVEMDVDMEEEEEEPIKVVKNYVRPAPTGMRMLHGQVYDPTKFAVSPITGELVAINEMEEHMRVSLIDPKWKEQREAMISRIKDTTKANDEEVTSNLMGLVNTRPDIFGSTEEEVTQVVSESIREKLTSGTQRPVAWDGFTQRGPELAQQVANIQQNRQQQQAQQPRPPFMPQQQQQGPGVIPRPGMQTGMPNPPMGMGAVAAARQAQMAGGMPQQMQQRMPPMPGMPPMPPPGGAPMLPREAPPPMPGDQPDAKRARTGGLADEFVLQPEDEFLQAHSGPSKVRVQCPELEGNEKLIGQLLEVEVASLQDTVGELKERLAGVLGLAASRQKISRDGVGFLKDEFSLAHYNVAPDVILQLGAKDRGKGRK